MLLYVVSKNTGVILGLAESELPRTQGPPISILEIVKTLATHSTHDTRRWLGPRDKPEEDNRWVERAASWVGLSQTGRPPTAGSTGIGFRPTRGKYPSLSPPPVFPETPRALSGTFHGSGETRTHNGAVKIPARAVCDGLAGKTGGGFGTFIPSTALLGRAETELPRTQGPAISILKISVTLAATPAPCTRRRLGPWDKPRWGIAYGL
jgi:hypothetical protein